MFEAPFRFAKPQTAVRTEKRKRDNLCWSGVFEMLICVNQRQPIKKNCKHSVATVATDRAKIWHVEIKILSNSR